MCTSGAKCGEHVFIGALVPEDSEHEQGGVEQPPESNRAHVSFAQFHALEPNSTCVLLGGKSVWFSFASASDIELVADTFGSDFDTVIDVFQGDVVEGDDPFAELTPVACNDNASGSLQSRLTFTAEGGVNYLIRVDNPLEVVGGALTFSLRAGVLPDVAMARPSPGADVGLLVAAAGGVLFLVNRGRRRLTPGSRRRPG